jgi:hypothetical protein
MGGLHSASERHGIDGEGFSVFLLSAVAVFWGTGVSTGVMESVYRFASVVTGSDVRPLGQDINMTR